MKRILSLILFISVMVSAVCAQHIMFSGLLSNICPYLTIYKNIMDEFITMDNKEITLMDYICIFLVMVFPSV